MSRRVVILLSDKRSGSTFLERELSKHPEIRHVAYTPHSYNETHYWLMAAILLGMPHRYFAGGKRIRSYGNQKSTRKLLIKTIQGNVPDYRPPENDRELVFSGWDAMCKKYATPVFFEKSPQHPHHWAALELMLQWAEQTDFDVRYILLYRNPQAVMYSALKLFYSDPLERQFGWAEGARNMLVFKQLAGESKCHTIRYESVVRNPGSEFLDLCQFIGISFEPTMGLDAKRSSEEKWRYDPNYILDLDESVKRLARYIGYSDKELTGDFSAFNERSSTFYRNKLRRIKNRIYNQYKKIVR